ncbi:hypothetical protein J6590_080841 [Homalodisca vitripennis]|nr:hypothetical protein J6590_080841 [Homalodisca vitripennis]
MIQRVDRKLWGSHISEVATFLMQPFQPHKTIIKQIYIEANIRFTSSTATYKFPVFKLLLKKIRLSFIQSTESRNNEVGKNYKSLNERRVGTDEEFSNSQQIECWLIYNFQRAPDIPASSSLEQFTEVSRT